MAGKTSYKPTLWCKIQLTELQDEDLEELRPDIAALHHLRGLSQHMFHEKLSSTVRQRYISKYLL